MFGLYPPHLKFKQIILSLAVALGLDAPGIVLAQAADNDGNKPSDQERADAQLSAVTVLGTSLELDVLKYPGSVTVLDNSELDGHGTVIEALGSVPGVEIGLDYGRSIGQSYRVRGFGSDDNHVIVQQDGVRRATALYSGMISSFRTDNDLLKRIEVVKGASAVSHGGGAIGGVIGMTTKDAEDFLPTGKEYGVASKLDYQHNDFRGAYVAGAWAPQDKPFELLAYVKRGNYGDYRLARKVGHSGGVFSDEVFNDEDLDVHFLKGTLKLAHGQRLTLSYYDYSEDVETSWNAMNALDYPTVQGPIFGTLSQRDFVANYTLQPGSPWIDFSATAYRASAGYDRRYHYITPKGNPYLTYENEDQRYGLRLSNLMRFATPGVKHRLRVGLDYEHREEDATYVLDGVPSDFTSLPNTYRDFGLYVQEEAGLFNERLVLHLGGRYDRFTRKVDAVAGSYHNSHFSPRLGFSLNVADGLHLLGNYSESFRAPTPHETSSSGPLNVMYYYMPNPDLKPEIAREFEGGFSFERRNLFTAQDRVQLKAMYFTGKIEDMIAVRPVVGAPPPPPSQFPNSVYAHYENVAEVKRKGYELTAGYQTRKAGVDLSYEHLKMRDKETGELTPGAFADKLRIAVHYKPLSNVMLQLDASHWFKPKQDPKTTVSGGQTYWYVHDDFTQVNARLRWMPEWSLLGQDAEVVLGVNNLFDKPYLNARNVETTTRVGKGRNIYLSLSARF
ncbi:MAG: TonB-dependent receptor [Candidatus Accumulibacter sp.]|jgi:iron complex outermembrane receptor protein/hemoglobin/transferrin/lactoferrin receptor protein|nr:TonB-dependent receptor [Accumulibacter sp.]